MNVIVRRTPLEKSDFELVEDFKNGKVEGFNELVKRYQQKVYWLVRRTLGNHEDADDVTQEVFVRVYQSLTRFRGDANFYTWLYRIATNLSLNALRKKKVKIFVGLERASLHMVDTETDPVEQIGQKEYAAILEKAIERLPPKQKLVFTMRYYEELPYEKMARILKRSVGGLKANYFHALKKIQAYVQKEMQS
jgi:RNA polymerase sigma-70 factor (ECF subfamily)